MNSGVMYLRSLAALMVVAIHMAALLINNGSSENISWYFAHFLDSFSRSGVPLFLMISGFLALGNEKNLNPKSYYTRRFNRLLPNLFVWSVFYFMLQNLFFYQKNGLIDWNANLHRIYVGEIYYHLWYMYMFIGVILVTPYLNRMLMNMSSRQIYLFAGLMCLGSLIMCMLDVDYDNWFFILRCVPFLSYYILGFCLRKCVNIHRGFLLLGIILLGGYTCVSAVNADSAYIYVYRTLSVNVFLMTIAYFLYIMSLGKCKHYIAICFEKFARLSVGIYYIHPLFIKILEYTVLDVLLNSVLLYVLSFFLVVFFSYIVSKILASCGKLSFLVN